MIDHPSNPDLLMSRMLGVCWHSPTSDRWPCSARPELDAVDGDGWTAPGTCAVEAWPERDVEQ